MYFKPYDIEIAGLMVLSMLVILGLLKYLRNDYRLSVLLIITGVISLIGFFIRSPELKMANGNAADSLHGPFIYILSYFTLRKIYIRKYNCEPTYYKGSWYDPDEGRNQNWLDIATYLFPLLVSFILPLVLSRLLDFLSI